MKKLLMILSAAVMAMATTTGCDIDANLEGSKNKIVVGNIFVEEDGWKIFRVDGQFNHLYADIPMSEFTDFILEKGDIRTYLRYEDDNGVPIQELVGVAKPLWRIENGQRIEYTETISCSYSPGNMRIEIYRSDFFDRPPVETLYFRTVIMW